MAFTKGPSQNPQTPAQAARTPASAAKTTSTKTVPPQPMLQPGETNAEHLERVRQWAADNNIKSPVRRSGSCWRSGLIWCSRRGPDTC